MFASGTVDASVARASARSGTATSESDDEDMPVYAITSPCLLCDCDTRGDYGSLSRHYMEEHYHVVLSASMTVPTASYLSGFGEEVDLGLAATTRLYDTYTQLARWLWHYDHRRSHAFDFDEFIINPESLGVAVLTVGDVVRAARVLVMSDDTRQFVAWRRSVRRYLSHQ